MDITNAPENVLIDRKKLYCLARQFLSLMITNNNTPFRGCTFCKLTNGKLSECPESYDSAELKDWLRYHTGVNLYIALPVQKRMDIEIPIGEKCPNYHDVLKS